MSEGFDIDPMSNIFIRREDDDDDDNNRNHWADSEDTSSGNSYVVDESGHLVPILYEILLLLGIFAIVLLCIGYCKIFCCSCNKEDESANKYTTTVQQTHTINIRDDDEETVTSIVSRNEKIDDVIDEFSLVDDNDIRPARPLLSSTQAMNKKAIRKQRQLQRQQYDDDVEISLDGSAKCLA